MRLPRVRFTIRRLMTLVAIAALVLAPFAWSEPGSRWALLNAVLTAATFLLIMMSPFLIDSVEGGRARLIPRTKPELALPGSRPWWQVVYLEDPPHRRGMPRL